MKNYILIISFLLIFSYTTFAQVPTFKITRLDYSDYPNDVPAIPNLVNFINGLSDFDAVDGGYYKLEKIPGNINDNTMLWITGHNAFSFTDNERAILKNYFENGGFLWTDDCSCGDLGGPFTDSVRNEMSIIFGETYSVKAITPDHPIYKSYYNFTSIPNYACSTPNMDGIFIVDRLVVVMTYDTDIGCGMEANNTTYLQFGTNITLAGYDGDLDGASDNYDNCQTISNPDQSDMDLDKIGDICDNCPQVPNPDQTDSDGDGIGDACVFCNIKLPFQIVPINSSFSFLFTIILIPVTVLLTLKKRF